MRQGGQRPAPAPIGDNRVGSREQLGMWQESPDAGVRRHRKGQLVATGNPGGDDDGHVASGESLEGWADQVFRVDVRTSPE